MHCSCKYMQTYAKYMHKYVILYARNMHKYAKQICKYMHNICKNISVDEFAYGAYICAPTLLTVTVTVTATVRVTVTVSVFYCFMTGRAANIDSATWMVPNRLFIVSWFFAAEPESASGTVLPIITWPVLKEDHQC